MLFIVLRPRLDDNKSEKSGEVLTMSKNILKKAIGSISILIVVMAVNKWCND